MPKTSKNSPILEPKFDFFGLSFSSYFYVEFKSRFGCVLNRFGRPIGALFEKFLWSFSKSRCQNFARFSRSGRLENHFKSCSCFFQIHFEKELCFLVIIVCDFGPILGVQWDPFWVHVFLKLYS